MVAFYLVQYIITEKQPYKTNYFTPRVSGFCRIPIGHVVITFLFFFFF